MDCATCGAEIPEGQNVCPRCYAAVRKPGLLRRMIHALFNRPHRVGRGVGSPTFGMEVRIARPQQVIRIKDETTGEDRVYHSMADVPPEIRARIEAAMAGSEGGDIKRRLTFRDATTGEERTYNSVDELPPDLRAIYERIQKGQGQ